jgi:hypothetical protein
MYVHIQEREGESGYRDFADLSEFVSRFPHRFLTPQLKMVPFLFLERDNAHGVSSLETRFSNVLFNVLHGIYYSCLGAPQDPTPQDPTPREPTHATPSDPAS